MAITIKSTYSLDVESVRTLESLAQRWGVSKSEALRRMIHAAAAGHVPPADDSTAALDALQASLKLTARAAEEWRERVRHERRAIERAS